MMKILVVLSLLVMAPAALAESRFHYDTLKIKAILDNPVVHEKFSGLKPGSQAPIDAIELISIDDPKKQIRYRLRSGKCQLPVELTWVETDVFSVTYVVVSVGEFACK